MALVPVEWHFRDDDKLYKTLIDSRYLHSGREIACAIARTEHDKDENYFYENTVMAITITSPADQGGTYEIHNIPEPTFSAWDVG